MTVRHQSQRRPPKPGPHPVHTHGPRVRATLVGLVGSVSRTGPGRWRGVVLTGKTPVNVPGWFKSRRNAVAAVLREVGSGR